MVVSYTDVQGSILPDLYRDILEGPVAIISILFYDRKYIRLTLWRLTTTIVAVPHR